MFRMMGFLVGVLVATVALLVLLDRADILQAQEAAKRVTAVALDEIDALEERLEQAPATSVRAAEPVIEEPAPEPSLPAAVETAVAEAPPAETQNKPLFASLAGANTVAEPAPAEPAVMEVEEIIEVQEIQAEEMGSAEQAPPPAPPNWYPLWEPFHSELSAEGFARRLERLTGLDYRVASVGRGKYQVAVAHTDAADIEVALARIEAATGLRFDTDLR